MLSAKGAGKRTAHCMKDMWEKKLENHVYLIRQVHRGDKKLHFNGGRVVLRAEILQNGFIGNIRHEVQPFCVTPDKKLLGLISGLSKEYGRAYEDYNGAAYGGRGRNYNPLQKDG